MKFIQLDMLALLLLITLDPKRDNLIILTILTDIDIASIDHILITFFFPYFDFEEQSDVEVRPEGDQRLDTLALSVGALADSVQGHSYGIFRFAAYAVGTGAVVLGKAFENVRSFKHFQISTYQIYIFIY